MTTKKTASTPQTARGAPFCLRLNTLRALSSASVICTHIMPFLDIHPKFRSLHLAGHLAVYLFFALSGYLLTLSFLKDIRRRLSDDKNPPKNPEAEAKRLSENQQIPQIQVDSGEKKEENGEPKSPSTVGSSHPPEVTLIPKKTNESFVSSWLKAAQGSPLVCMLCKFLWNRTWRIFPLFYACCSFLKIADIEGATWHPEPMLSWTWKDIYLLRQFPNHLWSMRIEMMYNYLVIPFYIAALYGAFKLQKAGYERATKYAFAAIVVILLTVAITCIAAASSIPRPVYYNDDFFWNLPPFFFGMLMGLLNFRLELEYNKRQTAAKAKAQGQAQKKESQEEEPMEKPRDSFNKRVAKYALSVLYKNRYTIVFWAVFIRIAFLNPGFSSFFTQNEDLDSYWYSVNYHSYWHALFVLINDSRGGFWKFMHDQPEPKPTCLHPTDLHRFIYYYGLWSYIIYLVHPLVFVRLGIYVEKRSFTVEYVVLSILLCLPLAGIIDFLIDKMLVNKVILGGIVPFIGNIFVSKKTTPTPTPIPEVVKISP